MPLFRMRDEHLEAFDVAAMSDFVRRVSVHLRAEFPREMGPLTTEEMNRFVGESQKRANEYDLESEYAVVKFAHLRILLGDEFETEPADEHVRDLLTGEEGDNENDCVDAALEFVEERLLPKPVPPDERFDVVE